MIQGYEILDGVLCAKERGEYKKVESADYYHETEGTVVTAIPVFARRARHLLMMEMKNKTDPIFAIRRVPKTDRLADLPTPEGYVLGETHTVPYVAKIANKSPSTKSKRPRR